MKVRGGKYWTFNESQEVSAITNILFAPILIWLAYEWEWLQTFHKTSSKSFSDVSSRKHWFCQLFLRVIELPACINIRSCDDFFVSHDWHRHISQVCTFCWTVYKMAKLTFPNWQITGTLTAQQWSLLLNSSSSLWSSKWVFLDYESQVALYHSLWIYDIVMFFKF